MPVRVTKAKGGRFRVTDAGRVTARRTTKARAAKQVRLLRGVAHGWRPTRGR